jgi:hypothetical protein
MDPVVTATFVLADWIAKGIASGAYERYGGVIREVATGRIVSFLREFQPKPPTDPSSNLLHFIFAGINATGSGGNAVITGKGLAAINQRLGGIEQTLQLTQEMLQVTSAAISLPLPLVQG